MSHALISAHGLVRRYGAVKALQGVSFHVSRGEIFGFLGPNGAGKTTTFELLSGLRSADEGEVRWNGERMHPTDSRFRARLGVVFQKPSVDDKLTARENLLLGAALYGLTGRVARERMEQALRLVELQGRDRGPVAGFSGGMRRRLELARVLLHEPELLILDEPTQGLDPAFFKKFWSQIEALRRERNLTILITTHDPKEAEICDRLAILDAGRIIAEGTPHELKKQVGGDVVVVEADRPDELVPFISDRLDVPIQLADGRLYLTRPNGHELIPRLVELFPAGRLKSVGLHAPTLADVFVTLAGRRLSVDVPASCHVGRSESEALEGVARAS
ncbi:MAG: ABC transporter ATP-binding protein [Deltaproteobacteria bacterium]|nr:ABC transporter ATP-binding protein [Deltaproteobacteria bacterium]